MKPCSVWQREATLAFELRSCCLQNSLRAANDVVRVGVIDLQERWYLSQPIPVVGHTNKEGQRMWERERERARGRGWEEGEGEEEEEKDPLAVVFHVNSIRCPVSSIQAMYNVTRDVQWRTTANIAKCKAQCAPPIPPLPLHPAAHLGVHGSLPSLLKLQHRSDLTGSWAHSVRPWITKQGEEWQHTVRIRRMYLQYPYVLDKATYQEEVRVCTSIWHMYHAWHIFNPWGWQKESRLGCNKNYINPDHWFLHPPRRVSTANVVGGFLVKIQLYVGDSRWRELQCPGQAALPPAAFWQSSPPLPRTCWHHV
jgi:hypothetical protein